MSCGETLDRRESARLAELHCRALPTSLVARLGPLYASTFYEYMVESPHERLFLAREDGSIIGACVFSLAPHTVNARLLRRTPLARDALRSAMRLPWLAIALDLIKPAAHALMPKLLIIFAAAEHRGCGVGAALIAQGERFVAQAGERRYCVQTEAEAANPALGFYHRLGFERIGSVRELGREFAVFEKSVSGAGR